MMKKTLTAFIFGSTALATSMSFLPLADVQANPFADTSFEDARALPKATGVDHLAISMISTGYEELFENSSDDESSPQFVLKPAYQDKANPNRDAKVGNFTTADAREMARYAQAVYSFVNPENDKDIQGFINEGSKIYTLKALKDEVSWTETTFQNQDTGIFVEKADGTAVLSFKGSDRLNTWLSDFNPVMVNHEDGGRYHSGFLTMYRELEAAAWNHIMNFAEKNGYSIEDAMEKITITGHSRGAGCAQVFADIARRKTKVAPKLITFAAPRALHKHTAGEFNEAGKNNHLNILQAKDIVGHAAFGSLNGGAHIGNKVKLPVDKASWMHMMDGYRKPLNTMHAHGKVQRERGSITGNTYRFESANANEKRDLKTEADNSVQAWAETLYYGATNPKQAANILLDRAEWAMNNPAAATERALDTGIAIAENVGEIALNTAKIGKLAAVGTVKKIHQFVTDPATKSAVSTAAKTTKNVLVKAYNAVKFW